MKKMNEERKGSLRVIKFKDSSIPEVQGQLKWQEIFEPFSEVFQSTEKHRKLTEEVPLTMQSVFYSGPPIQKCFLFVSLTPSIINPFPLQMLADNTRNP